MRSCSVSSHDNHSDVSAKYFCAHVFQHAETVAGQNPGCSGPDCRGKFNEGSKFLAYHLVLRVNAHGSLQEGFIKEGHPGLNAKGKRGLVRSCHIPQMQPVHLPDSLPAGTASAVSACTRTSSITASSACLYENGLENVLRNVLEIVQNMS